MTRINPLGMDIALRYANPQTDGERTELLRQIKKAENAVSRGLRVPVNENEYSALVSFTASVGAAAFHRSDVRVLCNRRDWFNAAREMVRTGKTAATLARRREEAGLLLLSALVCNRKEVS